MTISSTSKRFCFMADIAAKIKRVAIIGAGVMGGGIAAKMADAGVQ